MSSFTTVKNFLANKLIPTLPSYMLRLLQGFMVRKASADIDEIFPAYEAYCKAEISRSDTTHWRVARPVVVGLIGLPQDGKTTVADVFASEGGFFRIDSNMVRGWLIDAGRDYNNINAIILFMLVQALKDGVTKVILDSDNMLPMKRAFIESVVEPFDVQVSYIRVYSSFDIWLARLKHNKFSIHRMYADGIRRANSVYSSQEIKIPIEMVQSCVADEYSRQNVGHSKYEDGLPYHTQLVNDDSKEQLIKNAKRVCRKLLGAYGTQLTKQSISDAYGH